MAEQAAPTNWVDFGLDALDKILGAGINYVQAEQAADTQASRADAILAQQQQLAAAQAEQNSAQITLAGMKFEQSQLLILGAVALVGIYLVMKD